VLPVSSCGTRTQTTKAELNIIRGTTMSKVDKLRIKKDE